MLLHSSPLFNIYFGGQRDNIFPPITATQPLLEQSPFMHLKKSMHLEQLIFLHQTHSSHGLTITSAEQAEHIAPFSIEGDYLITCVPQVGLGVLTADCLPLILYDHFHHVIALVHAGWRGAIDGIALKVLERMQAGFQTKAEHVRIFFGPCAKVCCYQVTEDFLPHLDQYSFNNQVVHRHGKEFYFDLALFNRLLLEDAGVKKDAFQVQYNLCTIEDQAFFSHRRQAKSAGRQMTVVALK